MATIGITIYKVSSLKSNTSPESKGIYVSHVFIKREKKRIVLSMEFLNQDEKLRKGERYLIHEYFSSYKGIEQCYLGTFRLLFQEKHDYVFSTSKNLKESNMEQYALKNGLGLKWKALPEKELVVEPFALPCEKWIHLIENKKTTVQESKPDRQVKSIPLKKIKVNQCLSLSTKEFLSLQVLNTHTASLQWDYYHAKPLICGKNAGISKVLAEPKINSQNIFLTFEVIENKARAREKKQRHHPFLKANRSSFFSGWK